MITIDMRIALTVTVPDAAGVDHEYKLVEGPNDVPEEVAAHWYVKKFILPARAVPRFVLPSSARPMALPPAVVAAMGDALKPVTDAPVAPAPVPLATPPAEKAGKA